MSTIHRLRRVAGFHPVLLGSRRAWRRWVRTEGLVHAVEPGSYPCIGLAWANNHEDAEGSVLYASDVTALASALGLATRRRF